MKVLVTGSSGYLGTELIGLFQRHNIDFYTCSRHTEKISSKNLFYSMESYHEFVIPDSVNAVIHLASFTGGNSNRSNEVNHIEVSATIDLYKKATEAGARFIYISSLSAQHDSSSSYGKTKYEIECRLSDKDNVVIIRPGLVYGSKPRGLYKTISSLIKSIPAVPIFEPVPYIQIVKVDYLCSIILFFLNRNKTDYVDFNAISKTLKFDDFLRTISVLKYKKNCSFIYLPSFVTRSAFNFFKMININPMGILNYLSLSLGYNEYSYDKNFPLYLEHEVQVMKRYKTKCNIIEANLIFTYLSGRKPSLGNMIRYVKYVESIHDGAPLNIKESYLYSPWKLCFYDNMIFKDDLLKERLVAASTILECSPQGFKILVDKKDDSLLKSILGLIQACVMELIAISCAVIRMPFVRNGLYQENINVI